MGGLSHAIRILLCGRAVLFFESFVEIFGDLCSESIIGDFAAFSRLPGGGSHISIIGQSQPKRVRKNDMKRNRVQNFYSGAIFVKDGEKSDHEISTGNTGDRRKM